MRRAECPSAECGMVRVVEYGLSDRSCREGGFCYGLGRSGDCALGPRHSRLLRVPHSAFRIPHSDTPHWAHPAATASAVASALALAPPALVLPALSPLAAASFSRTKVAPLPMRLRR